jgi:hypothetical protein
VTPESLTCAGAVPGQFARAPTPLPYDGHPLNGAAESLGFAAGAAWSTPPAAGSVRAVSSGVAAAAGAGGNVGHECAVGVMSNGDRVGVGGSWGVAGIGSRNPHVVQNFAPTRTVDPQFGQRSIDVLLSVCSMLFMAMLRDVIARHHHASGIVRSRASRGSREPRLG